MKINLSSIHESVHTTILLIEKKTFLIIDREKGELLLYLFLHVQLILF